MHRLVLLYTEFFHLAPQGGAADAQAFGGAVFVKPALCQGFHNDAAFASLLLALYAAFEADDGLWLRFFMARLGAVLNQLAVYDLQGIAAAAQAAVHDETFCKITQLAHITRPGIGHQPLQVVIRHRYGLQAVTIRKMSNEKIEQQGNVFQPVPQRGNLQPQDVEPEE